MSGEYHVAAELQRRGVNASVTYGNAKSADVIAFSRDKNRVVAVEGKSTKQKEWVIGNSIPAPTTQPWVFVHFPITSNDPPTYYVVLQSELCNIIKANDDGYNARYKEKHGVDFSGKGVMKIKKFLLEEHRDKWEKITDAIV